MSSMTVKKFDAPSLHRVGAGRGLDQPARGGGVGGAFAGRVRPHENPDAPTAFGGQLQLPGFDLIQTLDKSHGGADAGTAQTFGQGPKLIGPPIAAQQDQPAQIDPRGRDGGQIKFALGIVPGDSAAGFLRGYNS